jgi:transposase-like protein
MSNQRFSLEFKDEAVRQIVDRGYSILARREQIKLNTMAMRRKMHERNRVESLTLMS